MAEITYIKDEYGRIVLKTSKEAYLALSESQKSDVRRFFRFNRRVPGWVSKSQNNTRNAEVIAKKIGGQYIGEQERYDEESKSKLVEKKAQRNQALNEKYQSIVEARKKYPKQKSLGASKEKIIKEKIGDIYVNSKDIPYDLAYDAYRGMSFSPEKRALSEQKGFVDLIKETYDEFLPGAKNKAQKEALNLEIKRMLVRMRDKTLALLSAKSRTLSPMITGPSNFPTRRNNKRLDTEAKRRDEYLDAIDRHRKYIRNAIENNRSESEKKTEIEQKLRKDVLGSLSAIMKIDFKNNTVAKIKSFYTPQLMRAAAIRKIESAAKGPNKEIAVNLLADLWRAQAHSKSKVFSAKNKIWRHLPLSRRAEPEKREKIKSENKPQVKTNLFTAQNAKDLKKGVGEALLKKEEAAKKKATGKRFSPAQRKQVRIEIKKIIDTKASGKKELTPKEVIRIAKEINSKRSLYSQFIDLENDNAIRRLPTERNLKIWAKNPGRSDLIGVDNARKANPTINSKRKK